MCSVRVCESQAASSGIDSHAFLPHLLREDGGIPRITVEFCQALTPAHVQCLS